MAPKNEIVKKSNALIRGHWVVESILEPRIVAVLASKVHINDKDFKAYEIPVSEILGMHYGGENLRELSKVVERVMGRVLTIYDDCGKNWSKYNVFSKCSYISEKGALLLSFHPDLKPHYLQLKERFTQYSLSEFMSLPSIYSQRLYEILKSWNDKPEIVIDIEELYKMLDVPVSFRKDFGAFRRKVLEQAHKDIVGRTDSSLWFDWEPLKGKKSGKKTVAVRFVFNQTRARDLMKNQAPLDDMAIFSRLQKQTNSCYAYYKKCFKKCNPKLKTAKCKFCVERGRLYCEKILEETRDRQFSLFEGSQEEKVAGSNFKI